MEADINGMSTLGHTPEMEITQALSKQAQNSLQA